MLVSQAMPGKAVAHAAAPPITSIAVRLKVGVEAGNSDIWLSFRQKATGMWRRGNDYFQQDKRSGFIVTTFAAIC